MTAIGGFLELESRRGAAGAWHRDALALTSGRACLRAILERTRPRRLFVPFYICDSALEPIRRLHIGLEFYGLTPSLEPERSDWPADASVLFVNYFDLKSRAVDRLSSALGHKAIVDDTQAFFHRGRPNSFSFNSARKFFGVPDGAYAYGQGMTDLQPLSRNDGAPTDHLSARLSGNLELGYEQYKVAEAQVSCEIVSPSSRAQDLLSGVAYEDARAARRRNFMQLHDSLKDCNELEIDLALDADAVPFCYPFLSAHTSRHEALWQREVFAPRLWPEVTTRPDRGFEWERDLAARLLPLPVDHRYGSDHMKRVGDVVREVAC